MEKSMKKSRPFRAWFYLRQGWGVYFAFLFAAVNTLTVTYYLAIDNYPALKAIFPSFLIYVVILVAIGIPILVAVGYMHFKKSRAFRSEASVLFESNPFQRRIFVNSEILLSLNLRLADLLMKVVQGQKLTEDELAKISKIKDEFDSLQQRRKLSSGDDLEFMREMLDK